MRLFRWISLLVVVGLLPITGRAQGPAVAFHGVGDLPGGPTFSLIRDATRAGGVIYAVGGAAAVNQVLCVSPNNPVGCVGAIGSDTAVLWTWDGTAGQMTALPNLVANAPGNISIAAAAITPDAAYIASQARNATAGVRLAVRVNRSLLPAVAANTNLNVAPFTAYSQPTAAQAISANGSVLVTAVNPSVRVARVDINNPAGNVLVPLLRPTDTNNQPTVRGISAGGNVIIGTSFANPYSGTNGGQAFRYMFNNATNTGSIAAIPFLPGGTWNRPAAISPSGQFTLVTGNSPLYPNGELAIHDAATNTFMALGSANTPWTPSPLAGMTADASVVVATFNAPNGYRQGYFRNANGWFHLESALGANGIDVKTQGWQQLVVSGISADGTLVYGQGLHNGNTEGFVAEFPSGYLAGFDVPAIPATDTAIVGTWLVPSDTPGDPQPGGVISFMADGSYIFVQQHAEPSSPAEAAGFERGRYTWNATTGAFTIDTVQDMNGDSGASDASGQLSLTATVTGDTLNITDPADPDGGPSGLMRLLPVAGTFVGGWIGGDATQADSYAMFVGLPDGSYYLVQDTDSNNAIEHDGFEFGTFTYNASTGVISGTPSVDTNGTLGFSDAEGPVTLHISSDDLTAAGTDDMGDPMFLRRIVDPNTVRPAFTSAGSVDGTLGSPFTFATSASFGAFSFTADGLPAGLSIDGGTGAITGTPTSLGAFAVNLTASNSLATGTSVLVITITDGTAPVIDVTANISETTGNTSGAPVVYTSPATHDNVDGDGVAICTPASGTNFAVGTTTVNCSATDAAGNTATSSFTVTVTYVPPPSSLPGHIHAAGYINGGGGSQPDRLRFNLDVLQQPTGAHHLRFSFWTVDFSERPRRTNVFDATSITSVTFSDDPAFLSGHQPNAATIDSVTFSGVGEFNDAAGYAFTVTASDRGEPGKNADTFSLEVRDGNGAVVYSASGVLAGGNVQSLRLPNRRMPPFISGGLSTVTEIEATNAAGAVFNYAQPTATDMDGAAVAVTCSPASGTLFPTGRTRITCTATDTQGRTSTERYRVIVSDSVAPAFTSAPGNITVTGTHATKGAKVDFALPTATDAVDSAVAVTCAPASGKWFDYGTTAVTCKAKDNAKNTSTVTFTITVVR